MERDDSTDSPRIRALWKVAAMTAVALLVGAWLLTPRVNHGRGPGPFPGPLFRVLEAMMIGVAVWLGRDVVGRFGFEGTRPRFSLAVAFKWSMLVAVWLGLAAAYASLWRDTAIGP